MATGVFKWKGSFAQSDAALKYMMASARGGTNKDTMMTGELILASD